MIILDTNVLSEAMKPMPDPAVLAWFDRQVATTVFISSVTVAELHFGVSLLPDGQRKKGLVTALEGALALFEDRVLPFDREAALH